MKDVWLVLFKKKIVKPIDEAYNYFIEKKLTCLVNEVKLTKCSCIAI